MSCQCSECINEREYAGEFQQDLEFNELIRLVNIVIPRLRASGNYSLASMLEYEIKKYEH